MARAYRRFTAVGLDHCCKFIAETHSRSPLTNVTFDRACFDRALLKIVCEGIEALVSRKRDKENFLLEPSVVIPYVSFQDDLVTMSREEIDNFLSIRFLFESYLANAHARSKPLSIAVFGPPGAGKSFVVREILRSVGKVPEADAMTFNLSQLNTLQQLSHAFRRIQDRALAGQIPVAFFDEFDTSMQSESLGWLKLFLAPMEDGKFADGNETFHVGPAVFVFGGGLAATFDAFCREYGHESLKKAPDFVSRLRGHLNVQDISAPKGGSVEDALKVRRALLLRSLLRGTAKSIFDETGEIADIDRSVVAAFINVPQYEHGTRSMQAIIEMSRFGDGRSFQKSSLPTLAQLNMHVDGRVFLDIVNREWEDECLADKR